MLVAFTLIALGILVNLVMLANEWERSYPQFTSICKTCGYQLPPMEHHAAIEECPGCLWMQKVDKNISLNTKE